MLQQAKKRSRKNTPRLQCSKCCRMEYHFLSLGTPHMESFLKVLTFGTISWVGQYRCVCCGSSRFGRFDGLRTKAQDRAANGPRKSASWNPIDWWLTYRDSWDGKRRRRNISRRFQRTKSKKKYRYKPFRKKNW